MIDYLRGKVVEMDEEDWVVETNNFGFRLKVTPFVLPGNIGEERCFLLRIFMKENGEFIFYGFDNEEERSVFDQLREIRGVNHRTAFKILSRVKWEELVKLILNEEISVLETRTSLSSKTIKRLVLELKPRFLKKGWKIEGGERSGEVVEEVREVLSRLGYRTVEIEGVIDDLWGELGREGADVETWIKEALIKLGGGV
ncbi:MAG TPA: OB-fold domain-containing protein [Candidatus Atribacteria bacterium]|nr:OB-fold domain-containing protein [Candidatus Atribacteria bacterium]